MGAETGRLTARQGKYLEIMFNSHGTPVGAQITNYLLEKVSPMRRAGQMHWLITM